MTSPRKKRQRYRARGETDAYARGGWGHITRSDLVLLRKAIRQWDVPQRAKEYIPQAVCDEMERSPHVPMQLSCIKTFLVMARQDLEEDLARCRLLVRQK